MSNKPIPAPGPPLSKDDYDRLKEQFEEAQAIPLTEDYHPPLPAKFFDLNVEHAKLLQFVYRNPHNAPAIMEACIKYLQHGTPEMIRIADAVYIAVEREITLMKEQIKRGVKI